MITEPNKKSFREQLLSQEKTDIQLQKNFQREVKKMYTEKLKKGQRVAYVLLALIISLFVLFFWAFSKGFEELQMQHKISHTEPLRLVSTWAMYLGIALVGLSFWPAVRGQLNLRFYPKVVRFIFWILILAMSMLFLGVFYFIEEHVQTGISTEITMITTTMILVIIMGAYMLLSERIDRGDLNNKAKTLELEYRLAELEEKLNRVSGKS